MKPTSPTQPTLSKPQIRAGNLWKIGELDDNTPDQTAHLFRKTELEAIVDALQTE